MKRVTLPVRAAYRAQHMSIMFPGIAAQRALNFARGRQRIRPEVEVELQERTRALFERDMQNVEDGFYPKELLFQFPMRRYAKQLPNMVLDIPKVIDRIRRKDYKDIPAEAAKDNYPPYFRRNFHWQSDGYFSKESAERYDVGVEFLFLGTADIMRRQVIPPITQAVKGKDPSQFRLLEVACGTGRTLSQISKTHPTMPLTGLDLSPYYLQEARSLLADVPNVSFVAENAEAMPFVDGYFDCLTCVYLFHELPKNARRNVYAEMFRVLKPGGTLVIEDSAQLSDSPELAEVLANFSREFHEPFYADYIRDDMANALRETGFSVTSDEPHVVAKVVVAKKPL